MSAPILPSLILFLIILGILYSRDSPLKKDNPSRLHLILFELSIFAIMVLFLPYIAHYLFPKAMFFQICYSSFILSILISIAIHFVLYFLIKRETINK
jgi:hypothetical protein